MAKYANRNRRTRGRFARKTTKKAKASHKVATVGMVKKMIAGRIEKKFYTLASSNVAVTIQNNTAPALGAGCIDCLPVLVQGSTSSTRVGNRVSCKKSVIKGVMALQAYDAITNPYAGPVWVKQWLVSMRNNNATNPTAADWLNFFKTNNTSTGFYGNSQDIVAPIDNDYWVCHKTRTFRLGATSNSASIPQATSVEFDNTKCTATFSYSIGKHLSKLIYNDATSATALNKNLWLVTEPVYMTNNTASGGLVAPIKLTYNLQVNYEDA